MVSYLEVIKGGAKQAKKVNLNRPLHPSIEYAFSDPCLSLHPGTTCFECCANWMLPLLLDL